MMANVWMSDSTRVNERVLSHMWMCHVTHVTESCHTLDQVMAHMWMSHVKHVKDMTFSSLSTRTYAHICTHICTHMHIYACVNTYIHAQTHTHTHTHVYTHRVKLCFFHSSMCRESFSVVLAGFTGFYPTLLLRNMCQNSLTYFMTHSHMCHDSFTYVPWLIHICAMTHSHMCHDSFIYATWLIYTCVMTHSHTTWLIHICAMTHSHVRHDSCTNVSWLILDGVNGLRRWLLTISRLLKIISLVCRRAL